MDDNTAHAHNRENDRHFLASLVGTTTVANGVEWTVVNPDSVTEDYTNDETLPAPAPPPAAAAAAAGEAVAAGEAAAQAGGAEAETAAAAAAAAEPPPVAAADPAPAPADRAMHHPGAAFNKEAAGLPDDYTFSQVWAALQHNRLVDSVASINAHGNPRTPVTVTEVRRFWGLVHCGALSPNVGEKNWWSTSGASRRAMKRRAIRGFDFHKYMPLSRFKLIKRWVAMANSGTEAEVAADAWMRCRPGVERLNELRRALIRCSSTICLDELMSAFAPQSTATGNLPHLTYEPAKPDPLGTMLKCSADSSTRTMARVEIMEGAEAMQAKEYQDLTFGEPQLLKLGSQAACTVRLVQQTCQRGDFAVADSWFGSVPAVVRAKDHVGVYLVVLVKKSSKFYPKQFLADNMALSSSGARVALTATINGTELVALGYKYNKKTILFFLFARGAGSCRNGEPYEARFADKKTGQSRSRMVPRPTIISRYFNNTPVVDNHNQARSSLLGLEKAWVTQNGWFRIETTLQGINSTDVWNICKFDTEHPDYDRRRRLTIQQFANELGAELIGRDNDQLAAPGPVAAGGRVRAQDWMALHTLERMPVTDQGRRRLKYCDSCKRRHGGGDGGGGDGGGTAPQRTGFWCQQCHVAVCNTNVACYLYHCDNAPIGE